MVGASPAEEMKRLVRGVDDVLIAPIGFVADHIETLHDPDVRRSGRARWASVRWNGCRAWTYGRRSSMASKRSHAAALMEYGPPHRRLDKPVIRQRVSEPTACVVLGSSSACRSSCGSFARRHTPRKPLDGATPRAAASMNRLRRTMQAQKSKERALAVAPLMPKRSFAVAYERRLSTCSKVSQTILRRIGYVCFSPVLLSRGKLPQAEGWLMKIIDAHNDDRITDRDLKASELWAGRLLLRSYRDANEAFNLAEQASKRPHVETLCGAPSCFSTSTIRVAEVVRLPARSLQRIRGLWCFTPR